MTAGMTAQAPAMWSALAPGLDAGAWTVVGLLALRVAAVFAMTPVLYGMPLPVSIRMLLIVVCSIVLASGLVGPQVGGPAGMALFSAALSELALGATMGLGVLLAFAAFSVAGQMLDLQIGFGIAQVIDPGTSRPVPILTSAFGYLAVVVFFVVDGHHALLRGLSFSLEHFPIGQPWSPVAAAAPLLLQVGAMFTLAFALAAPVVLCILFVEFLLGVIGRNVPQMNMFAVGLPLKLLIGLLALALWLPGQGGTMTRIYAGIASTWTDLFAGAGPAEASALRGMSR